METDQKVTRDEVLEYHHRDRPGKLQIQSTKPLLSQRDFSLAYSPGVAHAVLAVAEDPFCSYQYTARGNLVAVVTNGSAILGLGNRGPLPAKPVMEGKAVLFKQLADVDVFDIELDAPAADEMVAAVKMIAPGFGGINLEDIAAPLCFEVEDRLRRMLEIPVFHDDQHGTAIILGAALLNALALTGKDASRIKVVIVGAGAAGVASARMFVSLGVPGEHITMFDRIGMVVEGRTEEMDPHKGAFAQPSPVLSVREALIGADVLVGVSVADVITPEMLEGMAAAPLLFLLANPDPEIRYELAVETRPDAIVATGRSDYPNQVNNVLVFPYIFRGALDVRARAIDERMKLAAAHALAELTREVVPERVLQAYGLTRLKFGRDYIIPKPNDNRALEWVAAAVAQAAIESGVARVTLDLGRYRAHLYGMTRRGWPVIQSVIEKARLAPGRLVFPEGEHPRIVRAAYTLEQDGIAQPVLLGKPEAIANSIRQLGLDYEPMIVDPRTSPLREQYAAEIYHLRQRKGVTQDRAREMAESPNVFGLMMVRDGQADGLLSGLTYDYPTVLRPILQLIGAQPGSGTVAGVFIVISGTHVYFFADGLVNIDPSAEEVAEIAILTAGFVEDFDITPRIAMVSFSNFGSVRHPRADKMHRAVEIVRQLRPDLEVDGEMQADTALSAEIVQRRYPFSRVRAANVLIFPDLDAATSAFKVAAELREAYVLGPILLGTNASVHPLQHSADVDSIVLLGALAVVEAQGRRGEIIE